MNLTQALMLAFVFLSGRFAAGDESNDAFGHEEHGESSLMGIMYDLKQTEAKAPTGVNPQTWFPDAIRPFLLSGWEESALDKYYRVSKPLFTTQIFIPSMDAGNAPKAFNMQKVVKPSLWVIHYKGQVSPPTSGKYRFWGSADDIIAVAVNGKTVLVWGTTPWSIVPEKDRFEPNNPMGMQAGDWHLQAGDWFEVDQNDVVDLDVLIGECPGGIFNAFLMIEKQGENYPKDQAGNLILPIFQVAPYNTPALKNLNAEPAFSNGYPVWKCLQ